MLKSIDLQQEYGEFLNQVSWDWYCTLTFREKVSSRTAFRRFNRWKVQLKKAVNNRIEYVLVMEYTFTRVNTAHLHLLLAGVGSEKPYVWEKRWYAIGGLAKIEPYDPSQGACYYLGAKFNGGTADVMFSKSLAELVSHSD